MPQEHGITDNAVEIILDLLVGCYDRSTVELIFLDRARWDLAFKDLLGRATDEMRILLLLLFPESL